MTSTEIGTGVGAEQLRFDMAEFVRAKRRVPTSSARGAHAGHNAHVLRSQTVMRER